MLLKTALDQLAWLFFPSRFLFTRAHPQTHRVFGWETVRFVDSQQELEAVSKATGDVFLGGEGNAFLWALLGPQSVFLLDHERHALARHLAGRALTAAVAVNYTASFDRYIDEALDAARARRLTAVAPWSRALTMRAMCKVVLDIDDPQVALEFFRRFESTTSYTANLVSYSKRMWRPRGPLSFGAAAAHVVGRLDRVVYATIADRRRQGADGDSPLDALIRGQDEHKYDDGFIRDNVVALLAAGYETTGSALAWMLYWLSQPGNYARVRAKHAAEDSSYLVAFRNECLRYCPPVEILPRKIEKRRFEAAVRLFPDLSATPIDEEPPLVCPCVHRVHHDPAIHPDPERFEPQRFVNSNYRPTEFLPFGLGRRFCLGAGVGQRLMDRVLERLAVRGLRFEIQKRAFRPIRRNVIIWPGVFLFARLIHETDTDVPD